MPALNLPPCKVKVIEKDKKKLIFDPLRRRYVRLTPEEWVRQHFVAFLLAEKQYPKELIGNEIKIDLNGTVKRCDTIVYDNYLSPLVIIEYKAPHIVVNQQVFDQIVRYNMVLKVKYLIVSNGISHYCCKINYDTFSYEFMDGIPSYPDL